MVYPYVWNDVDHTQIVEILALPHRYLPGPSWVCRIVVPALGSPVLQLDLFGTWETRYSEIWMMFMVDSPLKSQGKIPKMLEPQAPSRQGTVAAAPLPPSREPGAGVSRMIVFCW